MTAPPSPAPRGTANGRRTAEDLLGPDQTWLDRARRALQDVDQEFLTTGVRAALQTDEYRRTNPHDPLDLVWVWEDVSTPLNALLLDLADGRGDSPHLERLMDAFADGRLVSTGEPTERHGGATWATGNAATQEAIRRALESEHPAGRFTALLLSELAEEPGRWRHRATVRMPVLLHRTHRRTSAEEVAGEIGSLVLTLRPSGPPGLHPDPALMAWSTIDEEALAGLGRALAGSPHADAQTCITWAVRRADGGPVRDLQGDSISAAAAVLLAELPTRTGLLRRTAWRVRPRRLSPHWAITAGLDGDRLTRVSHYDSKLAAVATGTDPRLAVIAAATDGTELIAWDEDPLRHLAAKHGLGERVRRATTVPEAVRMTRTVNRTMVLGLVLVLVVATSFVGVVAWARSSALAAERKAVAADLVQQARSLVASDPGTAAYAALAANHLDPSVRTQEAMAEVLEAHGPVVGTGDVTDSYVDAMATAKDTLLTLDGKGKLAAWTLPEVEPLGELEAENVRAVGETGDSDFAVLQGSTLHLYQAAQGLIPREVGTLDTSLEGDAGVFGPFSTSRGGVLLLTTELEGFFWDHTTRKSFSFDLSDRVLREPGSRTVQAVDVAPVNLQDSWAEGVTELADFVVATSADEVVRLRITVEDAHPRRPSVDTSTLLFPSSARAKVESVSDFLDEKILVGTNRGVQAWDTAAGETWEFPYGGWRGEAEEILRPGGDPVIVADGTVEFHDEPSDGRPRPDPVRWEVEGAISAAAEYGFDMVVVGMEDGTVAVLDPTATRFGRPAVEGGNHQVFTPTGQLLTTRGPSTQSSESLEVTDPFDDAHDNPYTQVSFDLPALGGRHPYLNAVATTGRWTAASGRRADGRGTIWVWPAGGDEPEREIDFGIGEDGEDPIPDIVQKVGFVDDGTQLVAVNAARAEIGFWSVGDWKQLATIALPSPENFEQSRAVGAAFAPDGSTVVVEESPTDLIVVDARTHEVRHRIHEPKASFGGVSLSADGQVLTVVDGLRKMRVFDVSGREPVETASRTSSAIVNHLAIDPGGTRVAAVLPNAARLEILDARDLRPVGPAWHDPQGYKPVEAVWSPDGENVAVTSMEFGDVNPVNGSTHVLVADSLTWVSQLCAMASSPVDVETWTGLVSTDLAPPDPCAGVDPAVPPPTPDSLDRPMNARTDKVMTGLPVPPACNHDAGVLVNGELPGQDPHHGFVVLSDAALGDVTGDGVEDLAGVISCSAGGVGWPPLLALYERDAAGRWKLLDHIESNDDRLMGDTSSERPTVDEITVEDGAAVVRYTATFGGDPACCGSLPVTASLRWVDGALEVSAVRDFASGAVNQLLNNRGNFLIEDEERAPAKVLALLEAYERVTVGVNLGTCSTPGKLSKARASLVRTKFGSATRGTKYCTVVGVYPEDAGELILRLEPGEGEEYRITDGTKAQVYSADRFTTVG